MDERTATWGAKEWMAQRVDNLGSKVNALNNRFEQDLVKAPSNLEQLFKMEKTKSISFGDIFQPSQYAKKVNKNFYVLNKTIKGRRLFEGESVGKIAKGLLIDDNVKPVKSLLKGDMRYLGSGAIRIFGLGFMGYDTLNKTKQSYQQFGVLEGIKTFGKEALKNLAAWQAAGVGFMFGKALLPSIGKLPIGGILTGTIAAISTGVALDKVLKEKQLSHTHGIALGSPIQSPQINYWG